MFNYDRKEGPKQTKTKNKSLNNKQYIGLRNV